MSKGAGFFFNNYTKAFSPHCKQVIASLVILSPIFCVFLIVTELKSCYTAEFGAYQ